MAAGTIDRSRKCLLTFLRPAFHTKRMEVARRGSVLVRPFTHQSILNSDIRNTCTTMPKISQISHNFGLHTLRSDNYHGLGRIVIVISMQTRGKVLIPIKVCRLHLRVPRRRSRTSARRPRWSVSQRRQTPKLPGP